jgi:hypothetical protein
MPEDPLSNTTISVGANPTVKKVRRIPQTDQETLATDLLNALYLSLSNPGENQMPWELLQNEAIGYLKTVPGLTNSDQLNQAILQHTIASATIPMLLGLLVSELKKKRSLSVAKVTVTKWSAQTTSVTVGLPDRPRLFKLGWVQWFESETSDYPSDACFVYYEKQLVFSPHPLLVFPRFVPSLGVEGTVELIL